MKPDCLYIVMPAYNEEENIEETLKQWYPAAEKAGGDSRLVVLNDGSRDKTAEKLNRCREKYPRLVVVNKKNEGHGGTIYRGYRYAIRQGADYIFQTDSDGQTLPEEFDALWKDREKCGLLIGNRKGRQDGASRVFVTRVLRLVIFLIFGVWVRDANTPFRLMRAKELEKALDKIPEGSDFTNILMTVIYEKNKMGVRYYPITFRPRQGGVNSINMKRIIGIGKKACRDFRRLRGNI